MISTSVLILSVLILSYPFQTFVRNLITIDYPNMMVMDWIDKIYRIFQNIDSDVIYYSTLTSFADLMKHRISCV